ncbi:glycosyltransferase [Paenibacillus sp. D2_2]|uniref:glycosyltransferase family 2 protein n=1 Tax=Paenibacillus sp. D2_2 TaxID=3073092 RepID=UPI00281592BB|nr:glycosyltransferase [Paenibacillus sp. D2_2]WMT40595.1 glycosyltransferase [Paenibacillus sp. D2_2]
MLVTQEATESIHSFKETERLLDVVTTQEDQLKLNDLQLYKLKEDVEIKENEVKQLIELNEASDIKLRAVELQTQQIREELLNTNDRLNQLLNSSSWKLTKPLRNLKLSIKQNIMKIKPLAKKVLGEKKVELIPLHQVVKCESGWVSTGDDPQFKLGKKIKKGWTEFSWVGGADHESVLDIYYDLGNGMGENQKLSLGLLPSGVAVRNIGRVKIPSGIHQLRLDPGCKQQTFSLEQVKVRHIFIAEMLVRPLYSFFKVHGIRISSMKLLITKLKRILNNGGIRGFLNKGESLTVRNNDQSYQDFINKEEMTTEEIEKIKIKMEQLSYKPMISIIVPVYNVDKIWLQRCIESVRQQIYPNWELCLVDDCSTKPNVAEVLKEYSTIDSRIKIKIRTENGHISRASNDGLQMAEGEFVALLDHDDELSKNALLENVLLLNEHPKADIIYSDEDKISMDGVRYDPFFKPDWSPDTLLSQMYTCHLTIYRTSLVNDVGGFRVGYEGSQDYDLMLRVSEKQIKFTIFLRFFTIGDQYLNQQLLLTPRKVILI